MIRPHHSNRNAYTLLELLAAMIAASVLLASMAGTIVVSTNLLESSSVARDDWHDRDIADRIAADLRYAQSIDDTPADGFTVAKANVSSGANESIDYQFGSGGLTRRIDSATAYALDEQTPSHTFDVESYSPPTPATNDEMVRVRSSSSASTDQYTDNISIDYPPGCQNGDLLILAVSVRSSNGVPIVPSGWSSVSFLEENSVHQIVAYRVYDETVSGPTQVNISQNVFSISAAMVAIENASVTDPANWTGVDSQHTTIFGFFFNQRYAEPLEPASGTLPHHLILQIVVGSFSDTLGMAAYSDIILVDGGTNSIAIVARNGPQPTMTTTSQAWHRSYSAWLQTGMRLGGQP